MIRRLVLLAAILAASPVLAIQPGPSGAVSVENTAIDVVGVDGGDSAAGTTRAANKQVIRQRRADDCTAQTDGQAGELCIDDMLTLYVCVPSSGACDTAGEWKQLVSAVRAKENGLLVGSGATFNFDSAFDVSIDSLDPTQFNIAPGAEITQLGSAIEANELPATVLFSDTNRSVTATHDYSGGGLLVPNGTGSAPTGQGRIFWKTNESGSLTTHRLYVGNGSAAEPVRERKFRGVELYRGYNGHCVGPANPDACCTGANAGTCASDHCTGLVTPDACCAGAQRGTCTGQPIANGTISSGVPDNWEAIAWGGEVSDTDGYHSPTSDNDRITIPTGLAGAYQFACGLTFAADAGGQRCVAISGSFFGVDMMLGSTCCSALESSDATAAETPCSLTVSARVAEGQYLKCWAWQSGGTTIDITRTKVLTAINSSPAIGFFNAMFLGE